MELIFPIIIPNSNTYKKKSFKLATVSRDVTVNITEFLEKEKS